MQEPEFPSEPSAATVPPRLDLPPRFHVPPAPRGGSAWRWVAVVLGLGLAASLGANLLLSAGKLAHAVGKGGHGRHGDEQGAYGEQRQQQVASGADCQGQGRGEAQEFRPFQQWREAALK